jgi:hypothetical protein
MLNRLKPENITPEEQQRLIVIIESNKAGAAHLIKELAALTMRALPASSPFGALPSSPSAQQLFTELRKIIRIYPQVDNLLIEDLEKINELLNFMDTGVIAIVVSVAKPVQPQRAAPVAPATQAQFIEAIDFMLSRFYSPETSEEIQNARSLIEVKRVQAIDALNKLKALFATRFGKTNPLKNIEPNDLYDADDITKVFNAIAHNKDWRNLKEKDIKQVYKILEFLKN